MKKFRFPAVLIVLCLAFTVFSPASYALEPPAVTGQAIVLADLETGEIIYSTDNINDPRSPASLTKIMTVLLAVEAVESGQVSLDDMVTAPANVREGLSDDSSTAWIMYGETMSFKDLLYCAMVQSANEACNVIGCHLDGSIDAFVSHMNSRAEELGCMNTHFLDPNGLSNDGHYCSAYDMYLIAREAVSHPLFMTICNTSHYDVPPTNMTETRRLDNSNALISSGSIYGSGYLYEYASGVKTGYTRAAGYCLVSTAEKDGIHAIAVVMGCKGQLNSDETDFFNFVDTRTLYDWLFENFSYRTLISAGETVDKVSVDLASGDGMALLHTTEDIVRLIPKDISDDMIEKTVRIYDDELTAPIAAGTALGEVTISAGGETYGTLKLVTTNSIELSKGEYLRTRIHDALTGTWVKVIIIIVAVIALLYFILVIRYRILRRRHIKKRRLAEKQRREREREMMQRRESEREMMQRRSAEYTPVQTYRRTYESLDADRRMDDEVDLDEFFRSLEDKDR